MNALDRIAELHAVDDSYDLTVLLPTQFCRACKVPWPCLTRRLCDEAAQEAEASLAVARGNAARLATYGAAVRHALALYERNVANIEFLLSACRTFTAALAAHDALTAETEGP